MITRRDAAMALCAVFGARFGYPPVAAQTRGVAPQQQPVFQPATDTTVLLSAGHKYNFIYEGQAVTFTSKELFDALKSGR